MELPRHRLDKHASGPSGRTTIPSARIASDSDSHRSSDRMYYMRLATPFASFSCPQLLIFGDNERPGLLRLSSALPNAFGTLKLAIVPCCTATLEPTLHAVPSAAELWPGSGNSSRLGLSKHESTTIRSTIYCNAVRVQLVGAVAAVHYAKPFCHVRTNSRHRETLIFSLIRK